MVSVNARKMYINKSDILSVAFIFEVNSRVSHTTNDYLMTTFEPLVTRLELDQTFEKQ